MAVIDLSSSVTWQASRWVFRYVIEQVRSGFPEGSPARDALTTALESELYWFSASELADAERRHFCRQVVSIHGQLQTSNPVRYGSVDDYEALKARISELADKCKDLGLDR